MRFLWSRVECEAAVGSNVRSVPSIVTRKHPVSPTPLLCWVSFRVSLGFHLGFLIL